MFIIYVFTVGPCRVSNCLRCQLLNSSCCANCEFGYEMNGCECEAAGISIKSVIIV